MALASGTKLGPYEILAPLGAGGMGEVYQARDSRLDRLVAIKILPAHLSDDPIRRQRFEREAKAISGLNHPNICTLHDVGRQDNVDFIVMAYLEGETLTFRLLHGPLPTDQVILYGTQIASALDKAHRSGVTHRDLKPGNIMLTKSGAKLLDFGLAKALPKIAATGTTLPEESPGSHHTREASAILVKDPEPISTLQPLTPPALERCIRFCLAKDPDDRWQSAGDLWKDLRWIAESGSQTSSNVSARAPAVRRHSRPPLPWILAALFGLVAVASLVFAALSTRHSAPLAFRQLNFRREAVFQAAFAPDKETVIYSAAISGNTPQIFMVRPEYPEPQPVGPSDTQLLAVSSKGELAVLLNARYVWYRLFTGTLARMPLGGGAPREVQEGVRQADWSPDGSQLAIIREVGGKDRLEYPIGTVLREVSGYMSDLRFSP